MLLASSRQLLEHIPSVVTGLSTPGWEVLANSLLASSHGLLSSKRQTAGLSGAFPTRSGLCRCVDPHNRYTYGVYYTEAHHSARGSHDTTVILAHGHTTGVDSLSRPTLHPPQEEVFLKNVFCACRSEPCRLLASPALTLKGKRGATLIGPDLGNYSSLFTPTTA